MIKRGRQTDSVAAYTFTYTFHKGRTSAMMHLGSLKGQVTPNQNYKFYVLPVSCSVELLGFRVFGARSVTKCRLNGNIFFPQIMTQIIQIILVASTSMEEFLQ